MRVLSVLDAYTREGLALEVDARFASRRVTRVVVRVMKERGRPRSLRGDHGPELASRHFLAWCKEREVRMVDIEPGRPLPNGQVESFQGKFRDECLNVSWFGNRWEACQKVAAWRLESTQERPHARLGYRTPEEFAAGAPAPPASPPTLAGDLKTQGNGVENSTKRVSASARI